MSNKRKLRTKRESGGAGRSVPPGQGSAAAPKNKRKKPRWYDSALFSAVALLFFASGFSSLLYQVVWSRLLGLVFGATTFATASVLAVFMGGLALGSFVAGRWSDGRKNPLLIYGFLEAGIGGWALATPHLFAAATPLYKFIWLHTHAAIIPFSLLRFVCTAVILIVPTALMGATLPVLSRYVSSTLSAVAPRVGALYAINTLGAIVGAIATGFVLLPFIGLTQSIAFGAGINGLLLLAVLILWWATNKVTTIGAATEPKVSRKVQTPTQPRAVKVITVAFALSGLLAMIYEVCWTRALLMVVGSSTYAFTIMLAAFLTGIFAGSSVCAWLVKRVARPQFWFALAQVLIGILTLVSMREFNYVPYWNLVMNSGHQFSDDMLMMLRFALAGSVLVPVTFCLGLTFPLAVKSVVTELEFVGRSVGTLYSANTLGAILGAFLAGFVCLPLFGAEGTLFGAAAFNLVVGISLLWILCGDVKKGGRIAATACGAILFAALCIGNGLWDHTVLLNAQSMRRVLGHGSAPLVSFEKWRDSVHEHSQTKFWADGACSNVGVVYHPKSQITSLMTNGHIDASDDVDTVVQTLLSGIPLALKPDATDVAVVGWGCGQTVGEATLFPVKNITAVELEPQVVAASRFFHHVNHHPEENPRVHLEYNDGRNFLLATDQKYDVIISEPSNPWQAGVCNLFTREYFSICHDRLRSGGLFSLWMQCAEVPPGEVCAVLNSLNKTFKYTIAFLARPGDAVVVASDSPIKISVPELRKLYASKSIKQEFVRVGIDDPQAFLARFAVASDGLAALSASTIQNTDDTNRLEFAVGKSYESHLYADENTRLINVLAGTPYKQVDLGSMSNADKADFLWAVGNGAVGAGLSTGIAQGWLEESIAALPTARAYTSLGMLFNDQRQYAQAEKQFDRALELAPSDAQVLIQRGGVRMALNKRDLARQDFEAALARKPDEPLARYLLAMTYENQLVGEPYEMSQLKSNDTPAHKVIRLLSELVGNEKFCDEHPDALLLMAQAENKVNSRLIATAYVEALLKRAPNSVLGKRLAQSLGIDAHANK